MHPYRFVTSLLSILLDRYTRNFHIFAHTPCTAVTTDASSEFYTVHTSRGTLRAKHVIHATNGWSAQLLRPLLTKITPARGNMSAQRPGTTLHRSTLDGSRSFVFYRQGDGYDYLTQLPSGEHELMFGGGWATACDTNGLPEIGIADDSVVSHVNQSYLAGALPRYFGTQNWGQDASPALEQGENTWAKERSKAQWSGILGISADMLPWVGRLPQKLSGRAQPNPGRPNDKMPLSAAPGEWIAAGYTGEGMVHAWMSAKALAYMVLDRDEEIEEWFPDILRASEKRWKEARIEDLFTRFIS